MFEGRHDANGTGIVRVRGACRVRGSNFSYFRHTRVMAASKPAEKISISVGAAVLKRAKVLAKHNGVSLSRLFTDALALLVAEEERRAAAREIIDSFPPDERVSIERRDELREQWATPHKPAPKKRRAVG